MLPGNPEVLIALGRVTRHEGRWNESIAYCEQALTLDPRNADLLIDVAWTRTLVRQFSAALMLYDRVLDITPHDLDVMAAKARIYHAEGNLEEAARLLSEINEQMPSGDALIEHLRLERNYDETIRALQARLAQFHYASGITKTSDQLMLALTQRLAGDTAGAKLTAVPARDALAQLYKDQPDRALFAARLSLAYAVMGDKNSALRLAERATELRPSAKDRVNGPAFEENLALVRTIFGENSRAISTLRQLLNTPYNGWFHDPTPVTPALLKIDPLWDPLRGDPAFQKLCEEKQP
jgi:tetratricopeptide (TPR) repeat protein